MSAEKSVLILEKSTLALTPTVKDDRYIFEGIFGEIGVRNRNERMYSEAEYVPQINELQKMIHPGEGKPSKLLGELDHPAKFDTTLANASHVIEELKYNKDTKKVTGKIRLLSTPNGEIAKALVRDGIPLHISSRAAGKVDEKGNVSIIKLFTYDLVAVPGFENAELCRVNEQFDFKRKDRVILNESLGISDENIVIYELANENLNDKSIYNINNEPKMDFVKQEDFDKYSRYLNEKTSKIDVLEKTLNDKLNEITEKLSCISKIQEDIDTVFKYSNYLKEQIEVDGQHRDDIVEKMEVLRKYSEYTTSALDGVIEHNNYIVKGFNESVSEINKLRTDVNDHGSYIKYLSNEVDEGLQYVKYISEELKTTKEDVDVSSKYLQYVAEEFNVSNKYLQYIAEETNTSVEFMDYLKENIETIGKYSNYLGETFKNLNVSIEDPKQVQVTNENYRSELDKKIELLIESARKTKAVYTNPDYNFLSYANESMKNEFMTLDDNKKQSVIDSMKSNDYKTKEDVIKIYESVVRPNVVVKTLEEQIPEFLKEKWNALDENAKSIILAQATYHKLDNAQSVLEFWSTRDLRNTKVNLQPVNESKTNDGENVMLNSFEAMMKNQFRK